LARNFIYCLEPGFFVDVVDAVDGVDVKNVVDRSGSICVHYYLLDTNI